MTMDPQVVDHGAESVGLYSTFLEKSLVQPDCVIFSSLLYGPRRLVFCVALHMFFVRRSSLYFLPKCDTKEMARSGEMVHDWQSL